VTRHEADKRDPLQEVFLKLARRPALLADVVMSESREPRVAVVCHISRKRSDEKSKLSITSSRAAVRRINSGEPLSLAIVLVLELRLSGALTFPAPHADLRRTDRLGTMTVEMSRTLSRARDRFDAHRIEIEPIHGSFEVGGNSSASSS
jgi:hypothetical protein